MRSILLRISCFVVLLLNVYLLLEIFALNNTHTYICCFLFVIYFIFIFILKRHLNLNCFAVYVIALYFFIF